jgi:hypothetical protein
VKHYIKSLTLLVGLLVSYGVAACSPPPPGYKYPTLEEEYARASRVVLVRVISQVLAPEQNRTRWTAKAKVEVLREFKGKFDFGEIATSDSGVCGLEEFETDQTYLLILGEKSIYEGLPYIFRPVSVGASADEAIRTIEKLR